MKKFIAIAGNIGVGKSTLVEMLCARLDWEPYFEPVAENPYLEDFYSDMHAWAFHSQVFFLTHRLRSHQELLNHPTSVVQDRSVYEDAEIFARNLYQRGHINERDHATYRDLFGLLIKLLKPPDLVVYLQASVPTLLTRIARRGRDFESKISKEYLAQLNILYEEWIADFDLCPVLTVPADELDFVINPNHKDMLVEKILEKLDGSGEAVFTSDEIQRLR